MNRTIIGDRLEGILAAPSSKSMSHRVVMAAALSEGTSRLSGVLDSVDLKVTIAGLQLFGAKITKSEWVEVQGGLNGTGGTVDCHESGSTIRFLIPISLLTGKEHQFIGCGKLVERPLKVYADLFNEKGIAHSYSGLLPFTCQGPLKSGVFTLRGDISSQFITGLLYTLPLLEGDSIINITHEFESKAYVDLTLETLNAFGITIHEIANGYAVPGGQTYKARDMTVEGDYSQGAFWIVAGLLSGELKLKNLRRDSLQGDKAIIEIAQRMGGCIQVNDDEIEVSKSKTYGTIIDASQIPDLVPILAVLASVSSGETRIINAERVRIKESDRLLSITTELKKMGANIEQTSDGLVIQGVEFLKGAKVDAWNDHRIAMALTIAALKADGPVIIKDAESINKSYPHFFDDFITLGGRADE